MKMDLSQQLVTNYHDQCLVRLRLNDDLNIAKIRRFCMGARKFCPPETFSIIYHYKRKLLAVVNNNRNKERAKMLGRYENNRLLKRKAAILSQFENLQNYEDYSLTSQIRTPKGQSKVSVLERCPLYRGHEYYVTLKAPLMVLSVL